MSTSTPPTAVVIDGYSAGNFYPAAFAATGTRVIHVQSTPELIPTMVAPNLAEYAENLVITDEAELIERLRGYDLVAVVPGQESAVRQADRVSEALGVKSNGTALSPARRDKYQMIEALRRAGVRCADQTKSSDAAELVKWAEDRGVWPVVVKPLSSAASDGVFICANAEEVRAAAERVLGGRDIFGFDNAEALIQSYSRGTEYVVDTVSSDGHRYAAGVWQYDKILLPSGQNIYNRDILLPADAEPVPALIAYVNEVLTALDVRWGPSHAEVIVTDEGPVLVEIATRFNGQLNPAFQRLCLGHDQSGLSALAYTDPERFAREYGGRVYRKAQSGYSYNPPTELDGTVAAVDQDVVARINELPSVLLTSVKYAPGDRIRPTTDLLSAAMRIYLTAPDDEQLVADYEKARVLKDAVYRVG
ncbi:ATP-grasp domain-containing protein [Actinacidiphila sp. ITFR-21]|uniref:ATP-grasp domain-containing protein n=1 Tax=Actinacidiphila sp. ITFR-21 TaxID=3075199 RepID=UPI00288B0661|nr:ATP-grasp domain-containing protein [Streptomyces sp. ITFR-21]WNI15004.1 ATP-grasp domain-containing protein [Streptomyces sp. ITFR-21]